MNRRDAIVVLLVLGAAALLAEAQQAKIPRVGVLALGETTAAMRDGFRLGLRDHDYVDGQNILVEWRAADGQTDRANALALELVQLKVDVIVASATPAVRAAKSATSAIPIIMAPAGDPVGTGFVASLARPGGNITGITNSVAELGPKLLELVSELRTAVRLIAVLVDSTNPLSRTFLQKIQRDAPGGIRIQPVFVRKAEDFDGAFAAMRRERVDAVIILPILATKRAADLAIKHRLLSITTGVANTFPELGGLMAYGENTAITYRHAAVYVDKILKGAKPADLPVEQPTKFELVINLKTTKALGIRVPQTLLLRADRVIE